MDPPVGSSGSDPHSSGSLESRLKIQPKISGDDRLKKCLAREAETECMLSGLIKALRQLMVRVKTEGVRENVDKVVSTFATLQRHRSDTVTEMKKQLASERLQQPRCSTE